MPHLDERAVAAYGAAAEVTKQVITLATAVFALTLTFADRISQPGHGCRTLLEIAWVMYVVSVALGLFALMAMAGQIADPDTTTYEKGETTVDDTINTWALRAPAVAQVLIFFAALVLTLIYGFGAV